MSPESIPSASGGTVVVKAFALVENRVTGIESDRDITSVNNCRTLYWASRWS